MSLLPFTKIIVASICHSNGCTNLAAVRNLMSKQLVYDKFGDPLRVVKFRECLVPPLNSQEVLVRMLAAPINPADLNTIQGNNLHLPCLPTIPGDEGVGEVMEIGTLVRRVKHGDRVVLTSRQLGTWRYYGVYDEKDVLVVSPYIPLPEASMLTIAPCMAYRMLKDFVDIRPGQTIIQNAANSPCGQCVIQLCKAWGIKTFNIVANHSGYNTVKEHLMSIGATAVHTLQEAEELYCSNKYFQRSVLALNCLGGRFENILFKFIKSNGLIVYYGGAFELPLAKRSLRSDTTIRKFHLFDWNSKACSEKKDTMHKEITQLMIDGAFKAPIHQPVELKYYVHALRNTVHCEAFSTLHFVFDFTVH